MPIVLSEIWTESIHCPYCEGEGGIVKRWGYSPGLSSEEEQIDVLRKCANIDIDKYRILGRVEDKNVPDNQQ